MSVLLETFGGWLDVSLLAWTLRLYTAAAIGQTLFVALWATLPWWRTVVGRALMVKSFALMVVLDWALVTYHLGPFAHQESISVVLFGLVVVGIWSQVAAIGHEMWLARRERRSSGGDHAAL